MLSTSNEVIPLRSVIVVPSACESEPIVIVLFANLPFAIEPAN